MLIIGAHALVGFCSGLIGAVGPVLNPLYLSAGITRDRLIATKTAIALPMQVVKLGCYTLLGVLSEELLWFGVAAGLGAVPSTWLARRLLHNMAERTFEGIVFAFMGVSGAWMIWQQREVIAGLWQ